jgi:hypothetical protein
MAAVKRKKSEPMESKSQALAGCGLGASRLAEFGGLESWLHELSNEGKWTNAWVAGNVQSSTAKAVRGSQSGPSDQGPRNAICAPH